MMDERTGFCRELRLVRAIPEAGIKGRLCCAPKLILSNIFRDFT